MLFIISFVFRASPARSMEVKNTPRTAKFVSLELTRNFFFKREIFIIKNRRPIVCLLMFCLLSYHIFKLLFLIRNFQCCYFCCE